MLSGGERSRCAWLLCFENNAWKASGRIKEGTESGGWVSGRTAGNDQQANCLWGICTISLCRYRAGVPDDCKEASAVSWLLRNIDKDGNNSEQKLKLKV